MKNFQLAKIFYEMADLLEMKEVPFKPQAYEKAARSIESLSEDIEEAARKGKLEKIPGVGKNIAQKIREFIKTNKIKDYENLKKECPIDIEEMTAIEGLGPKKLLALYKNLGIKNLIQLEKAAKGGKLRNLEGFGLKTEFNILKGIEFIKKSKGRFLLGFILPTVREIEKYLKKSKAAEKISIAGSVRRKKETIGDVDILIVSSRPKDVIEQFISMPEIVKIWAKGATKSSVRLKEGFDVDLRVIKEESFGAALQYFTGNKDHNIKLRKIAIEKGWKLNEYGLFQNKRRIAGRSEESIYKKLGLQWIPPELRENRGEIEAAFNDQLPKIIDYTDIKGDLHCHTDWSDGTKTIEEMAKAAHNLGHSYLAITDHTGTLKIAHGLNEKKLLKQMNEIDKINKRIQGIRILKGAEVNIKPDGTLDVEDQVLAKLDIVVAGVHSHFNMTKKEMTQRIIRATENKNVDIIVHPTGRILKKRKPYQVDLEEIFKTARRTETFLEINAYPERLDLNDEAIKKAVEKEVKLSIGTDSHSAEHLKYIELGIATARRGWAEKKDIINTKSVLHLFKLLKK